MISKLLICMCVVVLVQSAAADNGCQISTAVPTAVDYSGKVTGLVEIMTLDDYLSFRETVTYVQGELLIMTGGPDGKIEIDLPKLTGVSGGIQIAGAAIKGALRMENLVEVSGGFAIASKSYPNKQLTSVCLPNLVKFDSPGEINDSTATGIKNFATDVVTGNDDVKKRLFPK